MIHKLATIVAIWIEHNSSESEEHLLVNIYSFELIIEYIYKFIIILFVGYIFGVFSQFLIAICSFACLRFQAGGFHCKTSMGCLIFMLGETYVYRVRNIIKSLYCKNRRETINYEKNVFDIYITIFHICYIIYAFSSKSNSSRIYATKYLLADYCSW